MSLTSGLAAGFHQWRAGQVLHRRDGTQCVYDWNLREYAILPAIEYTIVRGDWLLFLGWSPQPSRVCINRIEGVPAVPVLRSGSIGDGGAIETPSEREEASR